MFCFLKGKKKIKKGQATGDMETNNRGRTNMKAGKIMLKTGLASALSLMPYAALPGGGGGESSV